MVILFVPKLFPVESTADAVNFPDAAALIFGLRVIADPTARDATVHFMLVAVPEQVAPVTLTRLTPVAEKLTWKFWRTVFPVFVTLVDRV